LRFALNRPEPPEWLPRLQKRLAEEFNWDRIAEATLAVYKTVLSS
jgi:glycosyltransferase involved in cell wall biosynthesis